MNGVGELHSTISKSLWIPFIQLSNFILQSAIDRSNISLTGFSIGGSATWTIGAVYHDTFARIAPCAGSVELSDEVLQQLSKLSIWAFIGAEDTVVNPQATRDCAAALSEREASIQVTEYDGVTHTEVPELAYTEPNLVRWLIGQ